MRQNFIVWYSIVIISLLIDKVINIHWKKILVFTEVSSYTKVRSSTFIVKDLF